MIADITVYHVNATVGKIVAKGSGVVWDGYAYDKLPTPGSDSAWGRSYIYDYLYSNTKSYSWEDSLDDDGLSYYRGRLYSLLPSTGRRVNGSLTGYANDRCLYTSGSYFNSRNYSSFKFDDGTTSKYGFTVTNLSSTNCTLTFTDF